MTKYLFPIFPVKGILSNIVKENGHLDILCNNAGVGHSDDVEWVVCINLVSPFTTQLLYGCRVWMA